MIYTRGTDLSGTIQGAGGIGGLLSRSSGYSSGSWTTHDHYHADGNGNITFLINSSQTIAASYKYNPFGGTVSSSGGTASANVYRFSSKEIHLSSGMYYYGYRFYDPNLQRWLNRDPLGEADVFNLYCFVKNNPLKYRDSYGLSIDVDPFGPAMGRGLCDLMNCYLEIHAVAYASEAEAISEFGANHATPGSVTDMMTHCLLACRLANSKTCKLAGVNVRQVLQDRESRGTADDIIDFHNNEAGFAIADKGKDCKSGCREAFLNGDLWTMGPGGRPAPVPGIWE